MAKKPKQDTKNTQEMLRKGENEGKKRNNRTNMKKSQDGRFRNNHINNYKDCSRRSK